VALRAANPDLTDSASNLRLSLVRPAGNTAAIIDGVIVANVVQVCVSRYM